MKVRSGFVSNSSSSSFIVRKAYLSEEEIDRITDHTDNDPWRILDMGSVLVGYTSLDNFDMRAFIEEFIGVPFAFCWINNPGWAWTSLFRELGGKRDLVEFLEDPDNVEGKPLREEWVEFKKELGL